ncbi:hypothetical protein HYH03_002282 [Edaphochlamys debaryana]|uniref:Uncharacterized protein n=1 Tax=Edaphochlamys debaryana TaxID=47281 RepID=A0A835YK14_9CHLO|nr:hypothetical protein HYH03_002282 [Edaphochlamys debaryana]|eukprot:KAG2500000.1 hypothetical protein HYH03_002282 [Edaphochlamys debaryana]
MRKTSLSPATGDRLDKDFDGSGSAFTEHFIKTLHRKLHDPSLLQVCPPPPPELFKHTDKVDAAGEQRERLGSTTSPRASPYRGHPDAWGSPAHPFTAPPGAYKLLSSDYAWLDAPKLNTRRTAAPAAAPSTALGAGGGGGADGAGGGGYGGGRSAFAATGMEFQDEDSAAGLPEPPLAMQQTRFLSHARLVLIKLRQQLEEVCVGAVRRMEEAVSPPPLSLANLGAPALSTAPSGLPGSLGGGGGGGGGGVGGGAGAAGGSLLGTRATGLGAGGEAAVPVPAAAPLQVPGLALGGARLPFGFADAVAENVRSKLNAAFEDCLSDTMDQLWGALQYAGSKHALLDRLKQAMQQREAELEALATRQAEEAASKLRALRRQKDEMEAAADKERGQLKALVVAANQRVEFLDKDVSALRGMLEGERASAAARLESQRASFESSLREVTEAAEAARTEAAARLEEARLLTAGLHEQLRARQEEVERLTTRAGEQADMLDVAFARRDIAVKEAGDMGEALDDYRRLVSKHAAQPLTEWLKLLKENGQRLTPVMGGPLCMEYGLGRAFAAAARAGGLKAAVGDLKKLLPAELPWPEDGWPPAGADPDDLGFGGGYDAESYCAGEEDDAFSTAASRQLPGARSVVGTRAPSDAGSVTARNAYPSTLPATWLRYMRAPLGTIMEPTALQALLGELAAAKRAADLEARARGLPPPDLHEFVFRRFLDKHPCAPDADEAVVSLVQSLRAHSRRLARAATWTQLLQMSGPVLPPDACSFYLEVLHQLLSRHPDLPHPVHDRASGTVWLPPARWKAVLNGTAAAVFDTEGRAALVKQARGQGRAAGARMDTVRGTPSFGMSDADELAAVAVTAAMEALATAWAAAEPVGGGALATALDVEDVARVAAAGLDDPELVPEERPARLDLYAATVLEARRQQAAQRKMWSGLTASALGSALASMHLLAPRPLGGRLLSAEAQRMSQAAGAMLRVADAAAAEMKAHAAFRNHGSLAELEAALKRLRGAVPSGGGVSKKSRKKGVPRGSEGGGAGAAEREERPDEEARRVAEGWAALEEVATALVGAREGYGKVLAAAAAAAKDLAVREALAKERAAEEAALAEARGSDGSGGRNSRASRPGSASRNALRSKAGTPAGGTRGTHSTAGMAILDALGYSNDEDEDDATGGGGGGGGSPAAADRAGSAAGSPNRNSAGRSRPVSSKSRPVSGKSRLGSAQSNANMWPRDLRATLAAGRWSSDDGGDGDAGGGETVADGAADADAEPPTLQLRGPSARRRPQTASSGRTGGGGGAAADSDGVPDGGEPTEASAEAEYLEADDDGEVYEDTGDDPTDYGGAADASRVRRRTASADAAVKLAALQDKYGRLRGRFDEAMRALHAAYAASGAAVGGRGGGGGGVGPGLPSVEVLGQMGPAARLRLVAELLAELHREVAGGVEPQLDDVVLTALMPGRSGGGSPSRPASGLPAAQASRQRGLTSASAASAGGGGSRPASGVAAGTGGGSRPGSGRPGSAAREVAAAAAAAGHADVAAAAAAGVKAEDSSAPSAESEYGSSQDRTAAAAIAVNLEPPPPPPPPPEVLDVAGRMHAQAGSIVQAIAAAALEAAALAAALDEVAAGRRPDTASRRRNAFAAAIWTGAGGGGGGLRASDGSGSPSALSPRSAFAEMMMQSGGGGGSGSAAAGSAVALLRRPSSAARSTLGGGGGANPVSPLPLHRLSSSRLSSGHVGGSPRSYAAVQQHPYYGNRQPNYYGEADGVYEDPGTEPSPRRPSNGQAPSPRGGLLPLPPQPPPPHARQDPDPWDAVPRDSDPRDTIYLDALRALHVAAEAAQAEAEQAAAGGLDDKPGSGSGFGYGTGGGGGGGAMAAVSAAVQELVRLMGGQPRVTAHGRVIEFFPRRIPKDWRHPLLRSSLTRLYVFVVGALLQQAERQALLREAAADLEQRRATLAAAAERLTAAAAELRGLQTALGVRLAVLAAALAHGSALAEAVGEIGLAAGHLTACLAEAPTLPLTPPPAGPPPPLPLAVVQGSAPPPLPLPTSAPPPSPPVLPPPLPQRPASAAPLAADVAADLASYSYPSMPSMAPVDLDVSYAGGSPPWGPSRPLSAAGAAPGPGPGPGPGPRAAASEDSSLPPSVAAPSRPVSGVVAAVAEEDSSLPPSVAADSRPPSVTKLSAAAAMAAAVAAAHEPSRPASAVPAAATAVADAQAATAQAAGPHVASVDLSPAASRPASAVPRHAVDVFPGAPAGERPASAAPAGAPTESAPTAPPTGAVGGGGGGGVSAAAVALATRAWAGARAAAAAVAGAAARLQAAAGQMAVLTQAGIKAGGVAEGWGQPGSAAGGATQLHVTGPFLPSGDQILTVKVQLAQPPTAQPPPPGPSSASTADGTTPGPLAPEALQFTIELPPAPSVAGASGPGGAASDATTSAAAAAAGGGVPQFPDVPTPGVSPEASTGPALPAQAQAQAQAAALGYSLLMGLRQANALATGTIPDDPAALPPGVALIRLSDALLRRSALSPKRAARGSAASAGGGLPARGPAAAAASSAAVAVDAAFGPAPAHYERRPMTARAFVEGVMVTAREQQLARLVAGPPGPMPRGALPEVEGMAHMDSAEAAALAAQSAALLLARNASAADQAGSGTALEALMAQHRETAAAANAAAASTIAAAAAAVDATAEPPPPASLSRRVRGGGSARPGAGSTWAAPRARSPAARGGAAGTGTSAGGDGGRLAAGVAGTRLASLPPMGAHAAAAAAAQGATAPGQAGGAAAGAAAAATAAPSAPVPDVGRALPASSAGSTTLSLYPGVQVDVAGRLMDWRLPLLVPQLPQPHRASRTGLGPQQPAQSQAQQGPGQRGSSPGRAGASPGKG